MIRINLKKIGNRIDSLMVSVLASSAIDCGFEPRSGQTKEYKIVIYCFSTKPRSIKEKEQRLFGSESE